MANDKLRKTMYNIGMTGQNYSHELYQDAVEYKKTSWHKKLFLVVGIAIGIFALINIVVWVTYYNRTYPTARVYDKNIGSVAFSNLEFTVTHAVDAPKTIRYTHNGKNLSVKAKDVKLKIDAKRTSAQPRAGRSWLPLANFFNITRLQTPFDLDNEATAAKAKELSKRFNYPATNSRLSIEEGKAIVKDSKNGFEVSEGNIEQATLLGLDQGSANVAVPGNPALPTIVPNDLKGAQSRLQKELDTKITYQYEGHGVKVSPASIGEWYVQSKEKMVLSDALIRAFLVSEGKKLGIHVKNKDQAIINTRQALETRSPLVFNLTKQEAERSFTYCVSTRGVADSFIPTLSTLLHDTYDDERGWGLDGRVEFTQVTTGCNYTVWLSVAAQMPSFGGACDSDWSCRSGNNVVINFDRWQNASDAWNAAKGTLENYRHMVINHETGHWLGFGHKFCGGPGQLAPVMQQQSINLQGCAFNSWPVPDELAALRGKLKL